MNKHTYMQMTFFYKCLLHQFQCKGVGFYAPCVHEVAGTLEFNNLNEIQDTFGNTESSQSSQITWLRGCSHLNRSYPGQGDTEENIF